MPTAAPICWSTSPTTARACPRHVAAQLFQPFTTGGRAGGAGLGLAIARDLVRIHGGDIALAETGPDGHDLPVYAAGLTSLPVTR